jgi:hypothetical protein
LPDIGGHIDNGLEAFLAERRRRKQNLVGQLAEEVAILDRDSEQLGNDNCRKWTGKILDKIQVPIASLLYVGE